MAHTEVTDKTRNRSNTLLGVGLAIILACAAFFSGLELGSGVSEDRSLEAGLFSFSGNRKYRQKKLIWVNFGGYGIFWKTNTCLPPVPVKYLLLIG
ncbi:MAG: hypothetical protein R3B69_04145 [Candidatus Paceibacterota bacterium]